MGLRSRVWGLDLRTYTPQTNMEPSSGPFKSTVVYAVTFCRFDCNLAGHVGFRASRIAGFSMRLTGEPLLD